MCAGRGNCVGVGTFSNENTLIFYIKIRVGWRTCPERTRSFLQVTIKTKYMYYCIVINAPREIFVPMDFIYLIYLSCDQFCLIVLCNELQKRTIGRPILILRPLPKESTEKNMNL